MSSGFENGSAAAEQLSALADGEIDGAAAGGRLRRLARPMPNCAEPGTPGT